MSTAFDVVGADDHTNGAPPSALLEGPPGSLLSRLRDRAAEAQRETVVDVDVGGAFGDLLVARYAPPPLDELERHAEYVGKASELSIAIDLIVRANVGMFARDGDRLEELADELGTIRLSGRLLRLLEIEPPVGDEDLTPREVLHWLFGGNGPAIATHVTEVMERMGGGSVGPTSPTSGSSSSEPPRSSGSTRSSS
jgi:hypothetical protein